MTEDDTTFPQGAATAIACAVAGALLLGCASKNPPPSPKKAPTSTRSAQTPKKPPPPGKKGQTTGAVKVDRSFSKPASGPIVARFDGGSNKGIDFGGAKGDPVRAVGDGKVVFANSTLRGYGQLVMIKHDATYLSAYAHNSELLVKEGQSVKRGQLIARMGNTESNRVKLHFELRKNGTAVDPLPFLTAAN